VVGAHSDHHGELGHRDVLIGEADVLLVGGAQCSDRRSELLQPGPNITLAVFSLTSLALIQLNLSLTSA
jgi:hypothetical protein